MHGRICTVQSLAERGICLAIIASAAALLSAPVCAQQASGASPTAKSSLHTTPVPPGLRQLPAELQADVTREEKIVVDTLNNSENPDEIRSAIPVAEHLLKIRSSVQGEQWWETISVRDELEHLRRLSTLSADQVSSLAQAERKGRQGSDFEAAGKYAQAAEDFQAMADAEKKILSSTDSWYANSMALLGTAYTNLGQYDKAEQLLKYALESQQTFLGKEHPIVAFTFGDLAELYIANGQPDKGEPFNKNALDILKNTIGDHHPLFARQLISRGDIYRRMHRDEEAELPYLQALEINRASFGADSPAYIENLEHLVDLYRSLNLVHKALPFAREMTEIRKRTVGERSPVYAKSLKDLAALYLELGQSGDAEATSEKALDILQEHKTENRDEYGAVLAILGVLNLMNEHSKVAEMFLHQSLEWVSENSIDQVRSLLYLGKLYDLTNRYDEGEPLLRQALNIRRSMNSQEGDDDTALLASLASVYEGTGRVQQAEPLYLKALEIETKLHGQHGRLSSGIMVELGMLYQDMQRFPEAEGFLRKGLDAIRQSDGSQNLRYALALERLASVLCIEKQIDQGEALYRQSLDILQNVVGKNDPHYAMDMRLLAETMLFRKRYEEAEKLLRSSVQILRLGSGEGALSSLGGVQRDLAHVYALTDRPAEAVELLLSSSRIESRELAQNFAYMSPEQKRLFLSASSSAQTEGKVLTLVFEGKADAKDGLQVVLMNKHLLFDIARQEGTVLWGETAYAAKDWQQKWREQTELRREYAALQLENVSVKRPLDSVQGQLSNSSSPSQSEAERLREVQQNTRYLYLRARLEQLEEQLRDENPQYASRARMREVSVEDVARQLRPGTALVEYVTYQPFDFLSLKWGNSRYGAFVLIGSSRRVVAVDLGETDRIDHAIRSLRAEFRHSIQMIGSAEQMRLSENQIGHASAELRNMMWRPLEKYLTETTRAYVAPEGQLALIPFEILAEPGSKGNLRYLGEQRELVYLGTGRDLDTLGRSLPSAGPRRKTAVLIGDPEFDANTSSLARIVSGIENRADSTSSQPQSSPREKPSTLGTDDEKTLRLEIDREWPDVPALGSFIRNASDQLRRMGWDVTTLTGENAVVEATLSVRGPTILQFATHGFSLDRPTADAEGWDNPLIRSMLILAGANKWEASHSDFYRVGREVLTKDEALARGVSRDQMEHARFEVADGILTAYQAAGMDLHGTELVNLTACETGMGDVTPEGVAGLRQSFLIAGARSLTISMWQIPVAETTEQMHDFYVRWLAPMQGVPPISRYAAFRAAQMAALSRARRTYGSGHPLYWGGVVFGGDPGDLPDLRTNQQFTTH